MKNIKITDFQKDLRTVPAVEDEETRLMYQIIDESRIMAKFDEILARLENIERELSRKK